MGLEHLTEIHTICPKLHPCWEWVTTGSGPLTVKPLAQLAPITVFGQCLLPSPLDILLNHHPSSQLTFNTLFSKPNFPDISAKMQSYSGECGDVRAQTPYKEGQWLSCGRTVRDASPHMLVFLSCRELPCLRSYLPQDPWICWLGPGEVELPTLLSQHELRMGNTCSQALCWRAEASLGLHGSSTFSSVQSFPLSSFPRCTFQ